MNNMNERQSVGGGYPPNADSGYSERNRPVPPYRMRRPDFPPMYANIANRKNRLLSVLCFLLGAVFSEFIMLGGYGITNIIVTILFYAVAIWYIADKQKSLPISSFVALAGVVLIQLSFLFSVSVSSATIATLVLAVLIPVQLCAMSGIRIDVFAPRQIAESIAGALGRFFTFFDLPFKSPPKADGSDKAKRPRMSGRALMTVCGVIASIPVAVIFLVLFTDADEIFGYFWNELLKVLHIDLWHLVTDIILGLIFGTVLLIYLFTLRAAPSAPDGGGKAFVEIVPTAFAGAFTTVIALIHVMFSAVQFVYMFSGGKLGLPNGVTYAQYARSGFFELAASVTLAFVLIVAVSLTVKRDGKGKVPLYTRIVLTVLCVCNVVVAASALMRMSLYIREYGLTVKRVLVCWFIILIAVCLIFVIVKLYVDKFDLMRAASWTVVAMTVVLCFANVNGLVAKFNVDRYLSNTAAYTVHAHGSYSRDDSVFDLYYLKRLGCSAVPQLVRVLDADDVSADVKEDVRDILDDIADDYADDLDNRKKFSFANAEAQRALEQYNIR